MKWNARVCQVNPKEDKKRWKEGTKKCMDIWKVNGKIIDLNPIILIIALNANNFDQDLVNFFKKTDIKNVLGFVVSIMS